MISESDAYPLSFTSMAAHISFRLCFPEITSINYWFLLHFSMVVLWWSPSVSMSQALECSTLMSLSTSWYQSEPLSRSTCYYDGGLTKTFRDTKMLKNKLTFLSLFVGQPLVHFLPVHRHLDQVCWWWDQFKQALKVRGEDWRVQVQLERQR